MKTAYRRFLLVCIGAISCFGAVAQSISTRIDALLGDALLNHADASVAVYDLTADRMLYEHRANKLCRPASVQKLVTTITALDRLGTDYAMHTELRYTGTLGADSILHGDLYVVGGFDPEFTAADLNRLIEAIPAAGIRSITGAVMADVSMADTTYWGSGWCWDDAPASFQPYYSPLLLEKGCVEVCVTPTTRDSIPMVVCLPTSSWYEIDNRAVCYNDSAGALHITRDWQEGSNRIVVSGNVERSHTKKLSIQTSDEHFFALFTERMLRYGIGATHFGYGICPPQAQTIASIHRPIADVVNEALKESDNLDAEALLYHLAAADMQPYASAKDAVKRIDSLLTIMHKTYRANEASKSVYPHKIVDGSGLSNYNMITAHLLLDYLRYAYSQKAIYDMITEALPHSGIDGTLKGRMGTKSMRRRIVAKTGSMTGVSTLAGYAHATNGHTLAFVILNQNVLKLSQARAWQDKVCSAIVE
jgi:D-alanyl-D-alanine carboxypeptidase/D-alanyl-D-alanine-endopeptidase (penicillin-binding protein 4)